MAAHCAAGQVRPGRRPPPARTSQPRSLQAGWLS